MFRKTTAFQSLAACLMTIVMATGAHAHLSVRPREAVAGANQKYTMRVPAEKAIPTVRIETVFPAAVQVSAVDEKTGWTIEQKKDAAGKIVGAVWVQRLALNHGEL